MQRPPTPDWRVGDTVRWYREQKGWNQTQLAEAAGVSLKTVSRIENHGNFEKHTLEAIASALKVEAAQLMMGSRAPDWRDTPGEVPTPRQAPDAGDAGRAAVEPSDFARDNDERTWLAIWRRLSQQGRVLAVKQLDPLIEAFGVQHPPSAEGREKSAS